MVNKTQKNKLSGFTVIELLVVIAIFTFILGVMLFKQQDFESGVVLTNTAYEIALTIRQAQVYGSAAIKATGAGVTDQYDAFQKPYGVYFATDNTLNKQFILYGDTVTKNQIYEDGEAITTSSILRGNFISDLCFTIGGTRTCGSGGDPEFQRAYVNFTRPNPDAIIKDATGIRASMLDIKLTSPGGSCRMVQVNGTGQISVKMSCL